MKKYVIICIMFVAGLKFSAQTIDEKIGKAMNESDWFALDSLSLIHI